MVVQPDFYPNSLKLMDKIFSRSELARNSLPTLIYPMRHSRVSHASSKVYHQIQNHYKCRVFNKLTKKVIES